MSYSNHYKSKVDEVSKEKGKKKKPKPKREKSEKSGNSWLKLSVLPQLLKDDRTKNVAGSFLLLVSAILLLSFTSFLFTWKIDQDKLFGVSWIDILTNPEIEIENWLGTFGALVSHQLINNGFGIASFVFVLLLFLFGFRIVFNVYLLPIRKTLAFALFFLVWASTFLGALFTDSFLFLGGSFGYHTNIWLQGVFGKVGAIGIIFFALLVFSIIAFNLSLASITGWLSSSKGQDDVLGADNPDHESEETLEGSESEEGEEEFIDEEAGQETEEEIPEPFVKAVEEEQESDAALSVEQGTELELEDATVVEETPAEASDELELEAEIPVPEVVMDAQPEVVADDNDVDFAVEESRPEEEHIEEEKEPTEELADYDPLLDLSRYQYPELDLLEDHGDGKIQVEREELEHNKNRIVDTLRNYNIGISKIKATIGPTVTLYEIVPEAGVRISKIKNLEDDIALSLAALGIRIIAPIPGKGTIGIEVPNQNPDVVSMLTVISSDKFQHTKMELPVALGKTISNEIFVVDLAKMPHLLMAGATGQGKSVGLNCILASLLYKKHPAQVKFVLVDPKKVELTLFNKIERHFLAKLPDEEEPIITDTSKVVTTLNSLCIEMDDRYDLLKNAQCRNIKEYNGKFIKRKLNPNDGHRYLPYIVLVVDEFADLIMTAGKEVEMPIARLAQLARAIGIHLIIATQRPSVNIITGTIKANFPSRIAFRVTSKIDSRTILDAGGAEQLIGRGDMLYSNGNDMVRLQCAFVDTPEVEKITDYIGNQQGYPDAHLLPEYLEEGGESGGESFQDMDRDALFEEAARVVVIHQQGSASLLQRKLKLGYNRAGRIVDQLEAAGVIGPFEGSKARQVLIPDEISLEQHLNSLNDN